MLDDPDFSTSNGAVIQQYQPNGGANQRWVFVPLADGNDLIVNAYSGDALDDPDFSTNNGTKIIQYQLNGGLNQQWTIDALRERQRRGVQRVQRQGPGRPRLLDQQRHPDRPVAGLRRQPTSSGYCWRLILPRS